MAAASGTTLFDIGIHNSFEQLRSLKNDLIYRKEYTMSRLKTLNLITADTMASTLLNAVEQRMGSIPNMIATLAHSHTATQAYLSFSQILAGGSLPAGLREKLALTVSEANQCEYCLAAHSFFGGKAGLNEAEILDARHGMSDDAKTHAALEFARKIVQDRGHISNEELAEVRHAGFSDGEIVEIVANVALSIFTNYFNQVAKTDIDFPAVPAVAMQD
jgi:uncharacterized peroxidase-related enzyme